MTNTEQTRLFLLKNANIREEINTDTPRAGKKNPAEVILTFSGSTGKTEDKITKRDETGGSEKLEDSGLRKLRGRSGGF